MRIGVLGSGLMGSKLGTLSRPPGMRWRSATPAVARSSRGWRATPEDAILAPSGFTASSRARDPVRRRGAAPLLLFIGIHNAGDAVAYHVFVTRPGPAEERGGEDTSEKKGDSAGS